MNKRIKRYSKAENQPNEESANTGSGAKDSASSAFALMILILLGIFAGISRFETFLPKISGFIEDFSAKAVKNKNELITNRKFSKLAEIKSIKAVSFPEPIKKTSQTRNKNLNQNKPKAKIPHHYALPQETNENLPDFPIVPKKPHRGDRLSKSLVVKTDFVPAYKWQTAPKAMPNKKEKYYSAPHLKPYQSRVGKYHVLSNNDTLWRLARKYYGNGKYWRIIAKANKGIKVKTLLPGKKIFIPKHKHAMLLARNN